MPAQAAQMAGAARPGIQQGAVAGEQAAAAQGVGAPAPDVAGQPAPEPPAAPGEFLASFVEDTLNQIPVVHTALQANATSAADVLRIDIHDNNDVTIYAGGGP
jgi:hypothetical protein